MEENNAGYSGFKNEGVYQLIQRHIHMQKDPQDNKFMAKKHIRNKNNQEDTQAKKEHSRRWDSL